MEQRKNELNVERLGKALSDILSRKYDCKVTIKFVPKDQCNMKGKSSDSTQQNAGHI